MMPRATHDSPDLTRLRQAVDASGEVIFMTDRTGTFTFVNPQFERLYGYSAADVVGRSTPRLLKGGEISSEYYADFWSQLLSGESIEREFTNRTRKGRLVNVEATLSPIWDDARAIVGFLAIQRDITARKAAEEALRNERDRAAQYLDVADVMLLALDADGRITMINRKGCAILGRAEDELLGRDWIDIGLPARARANARTWLLQLHADDLSQVESPVITSSGEERLIAWRHTVLKDATGHVIGTLSSGEDITDRRRADEALRESQSQLQLISDNVLDLVAEVRPDGTFVYVSPSFEMALGYGPDRLIGTSALRFVHPDDVEQVRAVLAETVQRRATGRVEYRYRRADGEYIWLETVGKTLADGEGLPHAIVLSSRDISERKRNEEVLRDYDRRLQIAITSADIAVFAQDRDLRYTWLHNPQLGIPIERVLGRTDAELFPPETDARITAVKQRALDTGERVRQEIKVDLDGHARYFELVVEPLRSAEGRPEGLIGAWLETTSRRQLEDQLRQAQKLEAIGSLAGGIAHDFNNLLTAILGYTDLATSQLDPESPIRRDLEEVSHAGRSAEALARQLLIFSRKSVVQPTILRLNEVVTRVDKILRRIVGEHVMFDVRLGTDLGVVRADAGQLEQVLMNLVVNARDAMPMGGVVTIETGRLDLHDDVAQMHGRSSGGVFDSLAVTDTGSGMPAEILSQIFDPFFTTKSPDKGTGLGLATVHGIVEQAGGFVTVSSEPGRGSTFTVCLPQIADEGPQAAAGSAPASTVRGSETIVFVEDDESIRAMAVRALRRYGYIVHPAANAAEAMALASELGAVDLLITDIVMPGINGRALSERLRASQPSLKVIFTSGFTDDSELLRDVRSAGSTFVQKPYTTESLARTVRGVLDVP